MDILFKRFGAHLSSATLVLVLCGLYLSNEHAWLDSFLPVNGKPLAIFTLIAVIVLHEIGIKWQAQTVGLYTKLIKRTDDLSHQIEVSGLIQAVNGLYGRVVASGDEYIDNEYTIKELAELNDMRERLGVNSYTQGRLDFLNKKIRRV